MGPLTTCTVSSIHGGRHTASVGCITEQNEQPRPEGACSGTPCTWPPANAVPRIQLGSRNKEQSGRLPRPQALSAHSTPRVYFQLFLQGPPLSPSSYCCSLVCTRESVSCEPSLRKGSQPASLWAAGCLAPPLLARPRVSTQPRGFLKLRGCWCQVHEHREGSKLGEVFHPAQKKLNPGVFNGLRLDRLAEPLGYSPSHSNANPRLLWVFCRRNSSS